MATYIYSELTENHSILFAALHFIGYIQNLLKKNPKKYLLRSTFKADMILSY